MAVSVVRWCMYACRRFHDQKKHGILESRKGNTAAVSIHHEDFFMPVGIEIVTFWYERSMIAGPARTESSATLGPFVRKTTRRKELARQPVARGPCWNGGQTVDGP